MQTKEMTREVVLVLFVLLMCKVSAELVYECHPNDTIVITNPDTSHYIGAYANNSVGLCTTTWAVDYSTLTITGCSKDEDIMLQISNRSQTDNILGGVGIYLTIIRCDEIDPTGVPRNIVAKFSPTLLFTSQSIVTPSFVIESRLTTGGTVGAGYSDGTLVTTADVGTSVNWILEVPDSYYAKMTQCTAYSGNSNTGTPSMQIISNGCTTDASVVESFTTAKAAVVGLSRYYYTTIHAFRFYNSPNIYLYCDVKICPSNGASNCMMTCSRRRRQVSLSTDDDSTSLSMHTGTGMEVLFPDSGASGIMGVRLVTLVMVVLFSLNNMRP